MPVEFVPIDRDTPYLLPPSVQDYLPEDHLARFVAEMVDQLDMSTLLGVYAGKGKKPYHPAMLVALLFYGYATGTFSSRKLEKATYDSIAFRFICANTHPDHRTIAEFRKRFQHNVLAHKLHKPVKGWRLHAEQNQVADNHAEQQLAKHRRLTHALHQVATQFRQHQNDKKKQELRLDMLVAMAAFVGWWAVGAGLRLPGELATGIDFASIPSKGLEAWDAPTFTWVSLGLAALSIVASSIPAARAGRVDPVQVLREE